MSRKRKLLILSLFLCLSISCIFGTESKAEDTSGEQTSSTSGMQDENAQRLEAVTVMDEDGNIYETEDSEGIVEGSDRAMYFRSAQAKVVNFRTKGNATTDYKEVGTGTNGYTNGAYGADAAYLGMNGSKVRFMLAGVVGEVSADEVQVINFSDAKSVSYYTVSNGRLMHYIAQNLSVSSAGSTLDNGPAPSYLSAGTTYYSYDGHYFYTHYGTMLADYQNNSRSQSVNAGSPFYNYFQYLPMRSKTAYSDSELNTIVNNRTSDGSKMKNTGNQFVSNQNTYGVNALLMAGIAANESAWGNSNICQTKNNLFGLNAVDSSPEASADVYASVNECIRQFSNAWMSRQYLNPSNWKYKGAFLGNKASGINVSYASDPYWGEKAAAIAWKLDGDGGSRDNGIYTIGIKDTISTNHTSVNVRSEAATASASMYKTGGHACYSVLVLDSNPVNGFYKVQSDAVLNAGRTGIASGVGEYNHDSMYAYISADYVTIVNQGSSVPVQKVLQSIGISTPPVKTVYTEGETFDGSGMVVMAQWSDGLQTDVTRDVSYMTDALSAGTTDITVSYTADNVTVSAVQAIQVKERAVVSTVEINPSSVEMKAGESYTFGVLVTGTGEFSKAVTWSVEGAVSTETKIDGNGKLVIAADETAESLTVKATATADSTKWAEAVVKVTKQEVEIPDGEEPDDDTSVPDHPEVASPVEATDETTGIKVSGAMAEGTKLEVQKINSDDEQYAVFTSDERVNGNTILGVFDIKLDSDLGKDVSVELSFPVDDAYNGQTVIIIHYNEVDGKPFTESYTPEVIDGAATITVTGFSPYVIALNDAPQDGETTPAPDIDTTPAPEGDTTPAPDTDTTPAPGIDTAPAPGVDTMPVPDTDTPLIPNGNNGIIPPPQDGETADDADEVPGTTITTPDSNANQDTGTNEENRNADSSGETVTKERSVKNTAAAGNTKITDAKEQKKAPKTGDSNSAVIWVLLLAASAIVGLLTGYKSLRKYHK